MVTDPLDEAGVVGIISTVELGGGVVVAVVQRNAPTLTSSVPRHWSPDCTRSEICNDHII